MGAGENGNNQREFGMGMGMNHREWEEMGLKKDIPARRSSLMCRHAITNTHDTEYTQQAGRYIIMSQYRLRFSL